MKKYIVNLATGTFEVEAASAKEAIAKVRELIQPEAKEAKKKTKKTKSSQEKPDKNNN